MVVLLESEPPANVDHLSIDKWWDWYQKGNSTVRLCPPYVNMFKEECSATGVNWLVLWCQFCLETGFGNSILYKTKLNMFGLGAVDADPNGKGASFRTAREAIRAGAQHLAVYAGTAKVKDLHESSFVLKRTFQIKGWGYFGLVKSLSELGGTDLQGKVKWASDPAYGLKLTKLYDSIVQFALLDNPNPQPIRPPVAAPAPVPPPVVAPPSAPIVTPAPAVPPAVGKPKTLPLLLKIALKALAKYGTPFVLGLVAAVAEPWHSILLAMWKALEAAISGLGIF